MPITRYGCYFWNVYFTLTAGCSTAELPRNILNCHLNAQVRVFYWFFNNLQPSISRWYTTVCMPKKDTRTYADRSEYLKKAVANRRRKLRAKAIEYGGGKCHICGYDTCTRALSFHHKDPSQKDFGLSARGLTRSWDKIKVELDKCILLCANCHMEVHEGITKL